MKIIVGDKCLDMLEAVGEVSPDTKYPRCTVHFYCNIVKLKAIHVQESKDVALTKAKDVKEMKRKEAAKKIEDSAEETLTYMASF